MRMGVADFLTRYATRLVGFVVAITVGFTISQTSLVSILSSLFSPVTILLAWIFLREPLHWSQWLGIGIIFVGIALVNV